MAYNVSDKYKEIRYSGDNDNQLYLEYDGVEVENAPILAENLRWERRILANGSKTLTLDNFISQTIELNIRDYQIDDISKEFYIKIGSMVNGVYEYVPLGYYHIKDNPSMVNGRTTYNLIDRSTNFDVYIDLSDFIEQNGGKITKLQAVQKYCELCGVEFANTNFLGSNEDIGIYDNTITARMHISYLAECAGCFATIGRDGKLYFISLVKPNTSNTHTIPERILNNNMNNSKDSFKISKVVYEGALMPFEKGDDTGDTLFINTSNPYISKQEDINRIYNQVVGLKIDNISTNSIIGDLSIDPWDYIQYTHTDDEENILGTYTSLAQYTLEFNGVFKQTFETNIDRQSKKINSTVNTPDTKVKRLKQEIDTVNASLKVTAEQVDELQKDITVSKTASGNPIEINDAGEYELQSIQVDGESYQKTYNGNQLIDISEITGKNNNVSCTLLNDTVSVTSVGSYQYAYIDITNLAKNNVGKTLYFDCETFDYSNANNASVGLMMQKEDGTSNYHTLFYEDRRMVPYTIPEWILNRTRILVRFLTNNTSDTGTYSASWTKPILSFEENAEYEPYVGAIPSPNVDYPQEIETVQGVTNLVESYHVEDSLAQYSSVLFTKFDLKPNTTYTFSFKGTIGNKIYLNERIFNQINLTISDGINTITSISKPTIPSTEYNNDYGWIIFKNYTGGVANANTFEYLMIEEGAIAHDYVPYGRWLKQITHGKNFLKWENNFGISYNNTFEKNIYCISSTILTKDLDNMILSGNYSLLDSNVMRVVYSNDYPKIGDKYFRTDNLHTSNKVIKINKNYKYVTIIGLRISNSTFEMIKNSFQLEEGIKSTEFESYKENTSLIDLNIYDEEGNIIGYRELVKVNNTRVTFKEGTLSKRIKKLVLTGTENWAKSSTTTGDRFLLQIPDSTQLISNVISTHFTTKDNIDFSFSTCFIGINNKVPTLFIDYSEYNTTTVEQFKTFLQEQYNSETPVIVYYVLANSQTYVLEYEKLKPFKGYNYITLNDDLYPNMEVEYLTDSKFNAKYVSQAQFNIESDRINSEINTKVSSDELSQVLEEQTNKIEQQITDSENKITLEVSQKVNDIQIGGENLLPNTKDLIGNDNIIAHDTIKNDYKEFTSANSSNPVTTTIENILEFNNIIEPEPNTEYTLSFYAKGLYVNTFFYPNCVLEGISSTGYKVTSDNGSCIFNLTDNWERYWVTYKTLNDVSGFKHILFRTLINRYASICGVKLEKGNKATDWSPASEDKLDMSKFTKAEIILTATDGKSSTQLTSDEINLNGVVTANENFKILDDGSMKAVNGEFSGKIELKSDREHPELIIRDLKNPDTIYSNYFGEGFIINNTKVNSGNNTIASLTYNTSIGSYTIPSFHMYVRNNTSHENTYDVSISPASIDISKQDGIVGTYITANDIYTPVLYQTSLYTQKKNFEELKSGLEIIKNIDIYKYNLKTENDDDKKHIGFIIGNDYNYSKEITALDKKGNEACVDIYSMASVCVKAIQEQQKQIDDLTKRVEELEKE